MPARRRGGGRLWGRGGKVDRKASLPVPRATMHSFHITMLRNRLRPPAIIFRVPKHFPQGCRTGHSLSIPPPLRSGRRGAGGGRPCSTGQGRSAAGKGNNRWFFFFTRWAHKSSLFPRAPVVPRTTELQVYLRDRTKFMINKSTVVDEELK